MKFDRAACIMTVWALIWGLIAVSSWADDWPVLRSYDLDHVERIALPIGGIGTGRTAGAAAETSAIGIS
jgi:hypothetical protein